MGFRNEVHFFMSKDRGLVPMSSPYPLTTPNPYTVIRSPFLMEN